MSEFDKYVAQWVSRAGDNLSKEAREQLLTNIHDSLGDYEALRDPKAARARKDAMEKGKQRAEEKRRSEEAQKAQEEQSRRRQERQANLPPLPPPKPNVPAAASASSHQDPNKPKKKKVAAKKSGAAAAGAARPPPSATAVDAASQDAGAQLGDSTSSRKGRPSQKLPYSKDGTTRPANRRAGGTVPVRDIDFKFGARVDEQLRDLEAGRTAKATPAAKKKVHISPVTDTIEPVPSAPAAPAVEESVPAAESNEDLEDAAAAAAAQKATRKRSSPPPLDQIVAEDAEREEKKKEAEEAREAEAVVEVDAQSSLKDSHDDDDDDENDDSIPSLGETKNYQDQLKAFHFASLGENRTGDDDDRSDVDDDDDIADEEEFIDDREDVRRRTMQMSRPSRPAISDSTLDIDEARIANFPTTPKSQNKVKTISRVLVRHFLFSTLDDSDIARFASIMDIEKFEAGEKLLAKGEPNDTFYIVLDGEVETTELNDAGEEVVVPLVRGSTCGDIALMYEVRNATDYVARTAVQCASIERRTYKMITSRAMEDKRTKYIDFLASIPVFAGLSPYELERVAESLKEDTYVEGQKVIAYGVPNHWLHIVVEGTLRVVSHDDEGEGEKEVALIHRGEFVGEIEFIFHHLPVASVYAVSAVVKTAKLSRRSFELVPSDVREKLVRMVEEDPAYSFYHDRMSSASPPAFDMTPPFDAPPASVQRSMQQHESEQSDGTSAATGTPPPAPV